MPEPERKSFDICFTYDHFTGLFLSTFISWQPHQTPGRWGRTQDPVLGQGAVAHSVGGLLLPQVIHGNTSPLVNILVMEHMVTMAAKSYWKRFNSQEVLIELFSKLKYRSCVVESKQAPWLSLLRTTPWWGWNPGKYNYLSKYNYCTVRTFTDYPDELLQLELDSSQALTETENTSPLVELGKRKKDGEVVATK